MTYLISVLILAIVLNEAIYGKQKRFARYGIIVLLGNMILFNLGAYNEQTSNYITYCGLAILALMVVIRLGWVINLKQTK